VSFHVEIRRSFRRAWAFNLDEQRLRREVVDPWRHGGPVELGDQEWDPRECELRILEGPELAPADLAMGRGWNNAERSGRDVAAEILERLAIEAASVTIVAETPSGDRALTRLARELGVGIADWGAVRARILASTAVAAGRPLDRTEVAAALLAVEHSEPPGSWLFEAGLALAAFGGRAIVAQLGDELSPPELSDLEVIRLDPEQPASLHALAERLRLAGCPLSPEAVRGLETH
jgi:hypothetical protein